MTGPVRRRRRPAPAAAAALLLLAAPGSAAVAQSPAPGVMPPPSGMGLAAFAALRFPQPVRVGDLLGRDVLRPTEAQDFVGTVRQIVRLPDGVLAAVIDQGGFLGFGTRRIAVPVDALVLLGAVVEIAAFTPDQVRKLPTYLPGDAAPLPPGTVIRVGLAKPSH